MDRIITRICMTLTMLAAFAFTPLPQSGTQNSSTNSAASSRLMMQPNRASQQPQGSSAPAATLGAEDRQFIIEAAHGGMIEITLGRMAIAQGADTEVRKLGQRMLEDHLTANNELQQLATQKGVTLPASDLTLTDQTVIMPSPTPQANGAPGSPNLMNQRPEPIDSSSETLKEQTEMNKLATLSGADFDRSYINLMVKDHEKDVKAFERQGTKGTDPDVRAWAAKMLPTLRAHYQQARDIQSRFKPSKK